MGLSPNLPMEAQRLGGMDPRPIIREASAQWGQELGLNTLV